MIAPPMSPITSISMARSRKYPTRAMTDLTFFNHSFPHQVRLAQRMRYNRVVPSAYFNCSHGNASAPCHGAAGAPHTGGARRL